jgi:hypothetical protein
MLSLSASIANLVPEGVDHSPPRRPASDVDEPLRSEARRKEDGAITIKPRTVGNTPSPSVLGLEGLTPRSAAGRHVRRNHARVEDDLGLRSGLPHGVHAGAGQAQTGVGEAAEGV